MNLKKQLQEKNYFLKKAYEAASNCSPSSPLSVDINPIEFGKSIDFDITSIKRIITTDLFAQLLIPRF